MSKITKTAFKIHESYPKHKMIMDPQSHRLAHPVYKIKDIETIS